MKTIHILLATDNAELAAAVRALLRTELGAALHYYIEEPTSYEELLKHLVRNSHDVCLLDERVSGTGLHGTEILQRANAGGCHTPTVLFTALPDDEAEEFAEDAGAVTFLNRRDDLHERVLRHVIRFAVRHFRDVQDVSDTLNMVQAQIVEISRKLGSH